MSLSFVRSLRNLIRVHLLELLVRPGVLVDFILFSLRVSGCAAFGTEVAAEHDYNLDAGDDHESPTFNASI